MSSYTSPALYANLSAQNGLSSWQVHLCLFARLNWLKSYDILSCSRSVLFTASPSITTTTTIVEVYGCNFSCQSRHPILHTYRTEATVDGSVASEHIGVGMRDGHQTRPPALCPPGFWRARSTQYQRLFGDFASVRQGHPPGNPIQASLSKIKSHLRAVMPSVEDSARFPISIAAMRTKSIGSYHSSKTEKFG